MRVSCNARTQREAEKFVTGDMALQSSAKLYVFARKLQPIPDTGRIAAAYVNFVTVREIFWTNVRRFSRAGGN